MNFSDLAHMLHKYRINRRESTAECVKILMDAILEDVAMESFGNSGKELNPMYGKSDTTLKAIYNGSRLKISQEDAVLMSGRTDGEHFADFVNTFSVDALSELSSDIQGFGFDAHPDDVASICGNIMEQIVFRRAEGKSDDITTLTIKKKETGKRIKDIALATIECRGDKLHICGEEIAIHQMLVPQDVSSIELKYIKALCDAYAQALGRQADAEAPSLPHPFPEDFLDQCKAYYSTESIENSIRDTFDDGEDEFSKLKKDAWNGISMTYCSRRYLDGYERLKNNKHYFGFVSAKSNPRPDRKLREKGICHILVNDGTISSWVV